MGKNAEVGHVYNKEQQEIQNKTGYNGDQDILKNIYDLEGNNKEWTAQADSNYKRVARGTYYSDASYDNFRPASTLNTYDPPIYWYDMNSSRTTLYL